eukprot:6790811-Prymnesium_polylepis.2
MERTSASMGIKAFLDVFDLADTSLLEQYVLCSLNVLGGAWGGRSPPLLGANVVTAVCRVGSVFSHLSFP